MSERDPGFVKRTPAGNLIRHGGAGTAYAHYGCRCSECKDAHHARIKRRQVERLSQQIPEGTKHGLIGTYTNWGCRCDLCKQANAARSRRTYNRKRGKS